MIIGHEKKHDCACDLLFRKSRVPGVRCDVKASSLLRTFISRIYPVSRIISIDFESGNAYTLKNTYC
jgi:hypothetical protein